MVYAQLESNDGFASGRSSGNMDAKMMQDLINSVKENEGYRKMVYKDSLGIDTIGYGFAIKDLELDEDICEEILKRKLDRLIDRVTKKWGWIVNLPVEAQEVIYEMCYQMGISGVSKFKKTLLFFESHEFKMAAKEMLDSKWAKSDSPQRAKRMSDIIKEL